MKSLLMLSNGVTVLAVVATSTSYARFVGLGPVVEGLKQYFYWAGIVIAAPIHLFTVISCLGVLFNKHRRQRMGVTGIIHALANVVAFISSYFLANPLTCMDMTDLGPGMAAYVHASSCMIAAVSSLGLLWMIPVVSKKLSRFFACAFVTSFGLARLPLVSYLDHLVEAVPTEGGWITNDSARYHQSWLEPLLFATKLFVVIPGALLCLLNYIDTWACFVLHTFNLRFKKPRAIVSQQNGVLGKGKDWTRQQQRNQTFRSSAYAYPSGSRTFLRSFRKCEVMMYLFPLVTTNGKRRLSNFGLAQEHPGLKPSLKWILYGVGETSMMLLLSRSDDGAYFSNMTNNSFRCGATNMAAVYNFYAVVVFGVTLLLKAKFVSVASFQLFLSVQILVAGLNNASVAPDGFLLMALSLLVLGVFVAMATWLVAEPHDEKVSLHQEGTTGGATKGGDNDGGWILFRERLQFHRRSPFRNENFRRSRRGGY